MDFWYAADCTLLREARGASVHAAIACARTVESWIRSRDAGDHTSVMPVSLCLEQKLVSEEWEWML